MQTKPAIIMSSKSEVQNSAETLKRFKESVSFRDTTFAPSKVKQVSGNKLRIEFDSEEHRKEALEKIKRPACTGVAENAKLLKPLIILKGVQQEVPRDELLDIVSQQNSIPKEELRLCFLQKNKNDKLFNAILEVSPAARKTYTWPTSRASYNATSVCSSATRTPSARLNSTPALTVPPRTTLWRTAR
jgi:hypothetical protein